MTQKNARYPRFVQFRAPDRLFEAIETAAERQMMTISEYTRQTLLKGLKSEGVSVEELGAKAA